MNDLDALRKAVEEKDWPAFCGMVESGAEIPADDRNGFLLAAAESGSAEAAGLLLDRGADIHAKNDEGLGAMYFALTKDFTDVARVLLAHGYYPTKDEFKLVEALGVSWLDELLEPGRKLCAAVKDGNINLVRALLDRGVPIDSCSDDYYPEDSEEADRNHPSLYCKGQTALCFSIGYGEADILTFLLSRGVNTNAGGNEGFSPLIVAMRLERTEMCKPLLDHGADPNIQDKDGETALYLAVSNSYEESVRLLLDHGASPNIQNKDGKTALILASARSSWKSVRLLLDHGADPNIQDKDGMTALMSAAQRNQPEIMRLLLNHGVDPNIQNKDGETALMWAARNNYLESVKLLLEYGADLNIRSKKGKTVLSVVQDGVQSLAKNIKENREFREAMLISINRRDLIRSYGKSPWDEAVEKYAELNDFLCEKMRQIAPAQEQSKAAQEQSIPQEQSKAAQKKAIEKSIKRAREKSRRQQQREAPVQNRNGSTQQKGGFLKSLVCLLILSGAVYKIVMLFLER